MVGTVRGTISALFLAAAAAAMTGCLKAREVDRGLYDPQRDEFRLVMVLENISGNASDLPYLDALLKNKDHLLAPCMPGDLFGFAPWYLRLDDHKLAKVTFTEPRPGDMLPFGTAAPLDSVTIKPGAFFIQDNTLCYYHVLVIPGKTADALLAQTRRDQFEALRKSIQGELDRRADKGRVHTWDELTEQEVKAVREESTEHPLKPFMVMDEASLKDMVTWASDPEKGVVRQGGDFTLTVPMTTRDRDGTCAFWKAWREATDAAAAAHKTDPKIALQRVPAQALTLKAAPEGVVITIDLLKLYNSFAEAFVAYGDSRSEPAHPSQPTYEARYAAREHWPLEENLSTAQILGDFANGTLKAFPSATPVAPGTNLKPQPK